jgi:hypothetical protein
MVATTAITIVGDPGAAPPNSALRVTNLDSTERSIVSSVRPDGSFAITVPVSPEDELRFQAVVADSRSAPVDARFEDLPARLTPIVRLSCVTLDPGLELGFDGQSIAILRIDNGCSGELALRGFRTRLGSPEFTIETTEPLNIAAGASGQLTVRINAAGASLEDTLFFDAATGPDLVRYPITLYRPR